MSKTQDVIDPPQRLVEILTGGGLDNMNMWDKRRKIDKAKLMLSALASAGYRLAGPGECVVKNQLFIEVDDGWIGVSHEPRCAVKSLNLASTKTMLERALLSASQQKAPGSGEASEGSKNG